MPAQASSFNSINVGNIRVTYLPDGDAYGSATIIFPASNEALWNAHSEWLNADKKIVFSIGGFLIETGDRKVIVDLGFGDMSVPFDPVEGVFTGGRFLDSLKQAGVSPADVDTVFYTHLHLDHVGWTAQGGSLTFPNAQYLAGAGEWDFWRGVTDENLAAVGPNPEAVQAPLEGHIDSVADGATIAPGVNAMSTPGHTPGHSSVVISSGADRALIMGDSIHCPLQFEQKELSIIFDVDPALATKTREKIEAELLKPQTMGAHGHFSGGAFGRLLPGQAKRWTAI